MSDKKQKMVFKVSMSDGQKSHSRALKIVVGFEGVEKAGLGEKDKSEIEVVAAQSVDPIKLTISLRKKMEKRSVMGCLMGCFVGKGRIRAHAELISLSVVGEKKEEKKEETKPILTNWGYWTTPHYGPLPPQSIVCSDPYPCSIM